ncbi:Nif3-like dinuclear metal center hexameric protein [Anaerovibrio sp.]|uniref:Nif3-like dinuclear metal center hexameric protein n=1 Tax=Anaerovibrio sp. TaxID=1872532 RepID=UPI0025FE7AB1|nr:Nif3-like dinuclear metal center hexameric protein [Anaerovibrio sp.]
MKCQTVMGLIEKIAPKKLAENWDNPGLQVGNPEQQVKKIMVCLDVSLPVVQKAIEKGADMIISHHPVVMFKGLMSIRTDAWVGKLIQALLTHNIAVYSAHTNLDIAQGGCNDILARMCGLENIDGFVPCQDYPEESMGRIGYLSQEILLEDYAKNICHSLETDCVRIVKGGRDMVKKVALCSGAGGDFISKAAFCGADVYITGDIKYHEAQQAMRQGINLIDAGHFATEFPVVRALAEYLRTEIRKLDQAVEVIEDDISKDYFSIVLK